MKLYLSSYHLGDNPQKLSELVGGNKKIAVILNALDFYTDIPRRQKNLQREMEDLSNLGLNPEGLDLREYFGKPEMLSKKMSEFGAVWVTGGNTFVLRRAFKESSFDNWLLAKKDDQDFVYAGYSAGVCVLSPSLEGLEIVDSPTDIPQGYLSTIIQQGLGIIDFAFAPHYLSDHPESEAVSKEVKNYQKKGIKYKTLSDGEVFISGT